MGHLRGHRPDNGEPFCLKFGDLQPFALLNFRLQRRRSLLHGFFQVIMRLLKGGGR